MTKSREYRKAEYSVFEHCVEQLNKPKTEVCEALGYSPNAWSSWLEGKYIPMPAAIGCEALLVRHRVKDKIFIVRISTADQETTIKTMLKALSIEFIEI